MSLFCTNMAAFTSNIWSLLTVGNVLLSLLFLLLLHYLVELYQFRGMPPGPRLYSIPFFGNFLSFDSGDGFSLRDSTQSLMKQYGRVFSLKLGSFKVVVAASADSVNEMLVKRSADYAGRPPLHSVSIATLGGKNLTFGDAGPAWRLHRRVFTAALRQYTKDLNLVEGRITAEIKNVLQFLGDQDGKPFDPKGILARSVASVICKITFGNRLDSSHPDFARLIELNQIQFEDQELNDDSAFYDLFPLAKYLPLNVYKRWQGNTDELYNILRKQLREGEKALESSKSNCDLVCSLIQVRNEALAENKEERVALLSEEYSLNDMEDMFAAGYETTSNTLRWAIVYLINYPEIQAKIQHELDDVVGHNRCPTLDDRPNLPLLQAAIMEAQRLGNVVSSLLPHYTVTDTTLCGYRVPKDTMVLPNVEAVHLDQECWENPEDFNPYRHIDACGNLITNQGNLLPFGAGRRVCPGESLAKVELFLFLSFMLQHYTFVPEEEDHPPSTRGLVAFTRAPVPHLVRATKRV